jgi:mono/diheme cytochrome c family protein
MATRKCRRPQGPRGLLSFVAAALFVLLSHSPVRSDDREQGQKLFFDSGCYGCHMVGKTGTPIGPDLSRVGAKYSREDLIRWLTDPSAQKPTAHMPKLELTEAQIRALAAYLASLR